MYRSTCFIFMLCLFLALASPLAAQISRYTVLSQELDTNWQTSTVRYRAVLDLHFYGQDALVSSQRVIRQFNDDVPTHIEPLLREWALDSLYTVDREIEKYPTTLLRLYNHIKDIPLHTSRIGSDFKTVHIEYNYPLFPFISDVFPRPLNEIPTRRFLPWVSSAEHTGLIIYAKDPLPLVGTSEEVLLQVSLYPTIYDEDLNPIVTHEYYDAESFKRWGNAAYTTQVEDNRFLNRVGEYPLRIVAAKVYGLLPTDIVLYKYDAKRILHTESLIRAVRQGRILIIVNDEHFESKN